MLYLLAFLIILRRLLPTLFHGSFVIMVDASVTPPQTCPVGRSLYQPYQVGV